MRLVRFGAFAAAALLTTQQASAQSLHGIRAEADVGIDRFYSEGNHDNHVGWGGEIGADFDLGGFVVGPYGSFWNSRAENVTRDGPGVAYRKSFEEWGAGLRAGSLITPSTLLYVKGGWVINEQRKYFDADNPLGSYYNHYRTRGWQVGAGIEQDVSNMFYVKGEGRYSNYRTNSSRLAFLVGAGVRFGGAEAAPPPPPPAPERG
jgi:outer membrane immunogenic protein